MPANIAHLEQLIADILEISREIGQGGVAYDINIRTYLLRQRALEGATKLLEQARAQPPVAVQAPASEPNWLGETLGYALFLENQYDNYIVED